MEEITSTKRPCPSCSGVKAFALADINLVLPKDHPFENLYRARVCVNCTTIYCDTQITEAELGNYYSSLAKYEDIKLGTGGISNLDRKRFSEVMNFIKPFLPDNDASILDIGCANGGLLHEFKQSGYTNLAGIDPSKNCAQTTSLLTEAETRTGTLRTLSTFERKFDLIVLSHVLEHLVNPKQEIEFIRDHLKENGLLYIEIPDPDFFYSHTLTPFQEFNTEHINHFPISSLLEFLSMSGFTCLEALNTSLLQQDNSQYPVIRGIWKKSNVSNLTRVEFNRDSFQKIKKYVEVSVLRVSEISNFVQKHVSDRFSIWGAGQFSFKLLALNAFQNEKIDAIYDSNSVNQNRVLSSHQVASPDKIRPDSKETFIVTSIINANEICALLKAKAPNSNPLNLRTAINE